MSTSTSSSRDSPTLSAPGEVGAQLLVVAERGQHGDGDHRPVADRQPRAATRSCRTRSAGRSRRSRARAWPRGTARAVRCGWRATAGPGSPCPRRGVRRSWPWSAFPSVPSRLTVQTLPPPTRCASATRAPSTWRPVGLAPQLLHAIRGSMARPVGPPGWPRAISPPSVLNGMRPPGPVSPSSTSLSPSPSPQKPEQLVVLELLVHERVVAERDARRRRARGRPPRSTRRAVSRVIVDGPTTGPDERVPTRVASPTATPTPAGARACDRAGVHARGPRGRGSRTRRRRRPGSTSSW